MSQPSIISRASFNVALFLFVFFNFLLLNTSARANDTFPGQTLPGNNGTIVDTNVGMTSQAGEPLSLGGGALNTQWYTWVSPVSGFVSFGTCHPTGSSITNFDTTLGVYTGNAVNALTQIAFNDDTTGCNSTVNVNYGSRVAFTAVAGTSYRIQVDGYGNATGQFNLFYGFSGFTTSITNINTAEGGATGAFTVVLTAVPTGATTITVGTSSQCTFTPSVLNFTTGNWNVAQTVVVTAINDTVVEGPHFCSPASLTPSGGGVSSSTAPLPTFNITDNDTATVTIANTTNGAEAGAVAGIMTLTLSNVSTANTVVSYTVSGTATSAADFTALSGTATILAGAATATISIPVIDDAILETAETVIVTLNAVTSGISTTIGAPASATNTIADNDARTVTIANTTNGSETGPSSGTMTVSLSAAIATNSVFSYSVSGTATSGTDFTALSGTVTILAGATTALITIPITDDLIVEGGETVIVTITAVTSGAVNLGATLIATNTITDNDSATVTIANTTNGAEAGPANGLMTITLTKASATPTIITYTVSGTATSGTDYTALSGSLTIPAGNLSAALSILVLDDLVLDAAETVAITLTAVSSGLPTLGSPLSATNTIADNDVATFTISKAVSSSNISAPTTLTYTITVTNTGNIPQNSPVITDSLSSGGALTLTTGPTLTTGDAAPIGVFGVGEVWVYTATYAVPQARIDAGTAINNNATFDTAEAAIGTSNTVTTTITQSPQLSIVKTPSTSGPVNTGNLITYTYEVTNSGNITVSAIAITDVHNGSGSLPGPSNESLTDNAPLGDSSDAAINGTWDILGVGDKVTFSTTYTVTQNDVDTLQ